MIFKKVMYKIVMFKEKILLILGFILYTIGCLMALPEPNLLKFMGMVFCLAVGGALMGGYIVHYCYHN